MASKSPGARRPRTSVKAPLMFSAVLAIVAGGAVTIFASGGSMPRIDLGLIAAGIVFIASLVVAAMLMMSDKPNDESLGAGSGINLRSAKIPGGAQNANLPRGESTPSESRYGTHEEVEPPEPGSSAEGSLRREAPRDGNNEEQR
ncbi:hypothetical protein [Arthrobacter castelli]|uniref:hypothetical protein n=1 Tax=Arthrobacter castelli TaxID=271431 RepID=UPI001FE205AB|nr:hypothetical protein [Arthrobacter castelli]